MTVTLRPFLWFDDNLDAALVRYEQIFGAAFRRLDRRGIEGSPSPGKTFTAQFSLLGIEVMALQGGPSIQQTPAFSWFVECTDQPEIDRYWTALLADGGKESRCGWLVDPFGVSWQIVPKRLGQLLQDPDPARSRRAMQAMLTMRKLDIAALDAAANAAWA